jgi:hypothetical protein
LQVIHQDSFIHALLSFYKKNYNTFVVIQL